MLKIRLAKRALSALP